MAAIVGWHALVRESERWEAIAEIVPAEVDGDVPPELILFYESDGAHGNGVRALDPDSGAILWSSALPLPVEMRCGLVPPVSARGNLVLPVRDLTPETDNFSEVIAIEQSHGAVVWRWRLPEGDHFSLYDAVTVAGYDVLVQTDRIASGDLGRARKIVTSLDAATGALRWEAERPPDTCAGPLALDDTILAGCRGSDQGYAIDPKTGTVLSVPATSLLHEIPWGILFFGPAQRPGEEALLSFPIWPRTTFPPPTPSPILLDERPVLRPAAPESAEDVALSGTHLFAVMEGAEDEPQRLVATPILAGVAPWSLAFADGFSFRTAYLKDRNLTAPKASLFHIPRDRYLLLPLRKEVADHTDLVKLAVIDLDEGRIAWESPATEQSSLALLESAMLHVDGLTLAAFPIGTPPIRATGDDALLVFDDQTGTFRAALAIREGERNVFSASDLEPWKIAEGRLHHNRYGRAWVLNLETTEIVWAVSDGIRAVDASPDLEAALGPLPRSVGP